MMLLSASAPGAAPVATATSAASWRAGMVATDGTDSREVATDGSRQLWCAKNDIYIQLWPLVGSIEVEKSIKGVVKKLGSRNHLGKTNDAYFPTLIS